MPSGCPMRLALRLTAVLHLLAAGCSCPGETLPPPDPPCARRTCSADACGELLDGCGGNLALPRLSLQSHLRRRRRANVCGADSCAPKTCFELGKNCDFVSDGCGKLHDCGRCRRPGDCGKFNKPPNVCGGPSCEPGPCEGACEALVPDGLAGA